MAASFGARQQGERWLFRVHLIRTVRYIPAMATRTDVHHPNDLLFVGRWERTLVIFPFIDIQHGNDPQCRVHTIVIEILMTTKAFSQMRSQELFVCPPPPPPDLVCHACLIDLRWDVGEMVERTVAE